MKVNSFMATTSRLRLTNFAISDAREYYRLLAQDEKIIKYVSYAWQLCLEDTYYSIADVYSKCDFKNDYYVLLKEKNSNTIIGAIIATRSKPIEEGEIEVAVLLGQNYRRKGYMTEAMKCFSRIAKSAGYKTFSCIVEESNDKSLVLVRKLGAEYIEDTKINGYIYKKFVLKL